MPQALCVLQQWVEAAPSQQDLPQAVTTTDSFLFRKCVHLSRNILGWLHKDFLIYGITLFLWLEETDFRLHLPPPHFNGAPPHCGSQQEETELKHCPNLRASEAFGCCSLLVGLFLRISVALSFHCPAFQWPPPG